MMAMLKYWTEEALRERDRPEEGDWFFFCSLNTATASPEDMYLSPVWEQAFFRNDKMTLDNSRPTGKVHE
jgi:hypothetical protein